ncbi:MAG: DUF4115 domain-containing protein [Alphaproteobacteria bacterium]
MLDRRQYRDRNEPTVEPRLTVVDEPSLFENALPSVGRDLRLAREATGATVEDIAAHLRIRTDYIVAIEAEDFDKLPAPAYVSGFLRTYANCVGLDPDRVIAAYKTELAPGSSKAALVFPTPLDEPRRPRGLIMVGAFLVALMIYGAWSYVQTRDRLALDYVPAPPARLTALIGTTPVIEAVSAIRPQAAPVSIVTPEPMGGALAAAVDQAAMADDTAGAFDASLVSLAEARPAAAEEVDAAPTRPANEQAMLAYLAPVTASPERRLPETPVVAPVDVQAEIAPEIPADTPAPTPVANAENDDEAARPANDLQVAMTAPAASPVQTPPAPIAVAAPEPPTVPRVGSGGYAPQTYGLANANARVQLRALADSWVQVQGPDNELLLTRILRSGDTYRAPNRPDIVMMTGNAGALEVIVDGRPLGPLGGEGQVRRNVPLAAEQLVALVASVAD